MLFLQKHEQLLVLQTFLKDLVFLRIKIVEELVVRFLETLL